MSRYLIYKLVVNFLFPLSMAGEAVLIPKQNGENIYVKKYDIGKSMIKYTDCNDIIEAKPSEQYTIMNDDSACLAVSFAKQMETIRSALKVTWDTPEISNVVIEYRKLDAAGFKSKEEVLLSYQSAPFSKIGQIKEGDRFKLVFYINDGAGCRYSDLKSIQAKLIKLGFSESYFKVVKNKLSNSCEGKTNFQPK